MDHADVRVRAVRQLGNGVARGGVRRQAGPLRCIPDGRIRIPGRLGERKTLDFAETWSREDDATIETRKFYPIGPDVVLSSARVRRTKCQCAEAEENAPADTPDTDGGR